MQEASVEPPRNWEEMQGSDFPMLFYGKPDLILYFDCRHRHPDFWGRP
jgi:hypothetical protein